MADHILENEILKLRVSDRGAELCSVFDKQRGAERLWGADPAVWNRHAPILFPFVGKVTGGVYRFGGREYPMKTQHGFARDLDFVCEEAGPAHIVHRLQASEATLAAYPFPFTLRVSHALDPEDARLLHIGWEIANEGSGAMYFAIGGHPGFLPPPSVRKEDCFLAFEGARPLRYFSADDAGFALPETRFSLDAAQECFPVLPSLAETWIFADGQVESVSLLGPDRSPWVTLRCVGFPLLAVWAREDGPFVCLEPWFGRTDDAGFSGSLEEKPGEQRLAPGERRRIAYDIVFHA